ncbi:hypothetical protein F4814DRAFT_451448 [Daldinia grandis]|nr:hypothetical protein F4814DRAFT_451448 [Daldinia grandis]
MTTTLKDSWWETRNPPAASSGLSFQDKSVEGYGIYTQVNVLSNTLIALLIIFKLRASATELDHDVLPHLCFLNSLASHVVEPAMLPTDQTLLEKLDDPSKFDTIAQYYLAKSAAFFAIQGIIEELKKRGEVDGIIINACCPDLYKPNMQRDFPLA